MEVLVATGLGAVVFAGSMKTLTISLNASRLVTATLTEADLRHVVGQVVTDQPACIANFDPKSNTVPTSITETTALGLYGPQKDWGRGEVVRLAKGASSIRRGEQFKGDLEIVKMELTGGGTGETAKPTPANPSSDKKRTFTVFYKKLNVGPAYNTVGGGECTASNTAGCFFHKCDLTYILNSAGNAVETCTAGDCVSYGQSSQAGGSPAHCYHFPDDTTDNILIGCGDTKNTSGPHTLAIGYNAGGSSISSNPVKGRWNHLIGYEAGTNITEGSFNTFFGHNAGHETTKGGNNVFIGGEAGYRNKVSGGNVFIGSAAGHDTGQGAIKATEGSYNVFIGSLAGRLNTKGRDNTFLGYQAGYKSTEGSYNAFMGSWTGRLNTKGNYNTFLGFRAGINNTEGDTNVFVGTYAGHDNKKGSQNTALGYQAGDKNTEGDGNVFVGYSAGSTNTKGDKNVFIGYQAGKDTQIGTGGNENFFFGNNAGENTKVTSAGNTFIGQSAGKSATVSGAGNTFLGQNAGQGRTITEAGNTYIAGKKVFIKGGNLQCGKSQYLRGFKPDGTKDCHDLPKPAQVCGKGFIKGYNAQGKPLCTTIADLKRDILKQVGSCGNNRYIRGFYSNTGNKNCKTLPAQTPVADPSPPAPDPTPSIVSFTSRWQERRVSRTCITRLPIDKGSRCTSWRPVNQITDCSCQALRINGVNQPCVSVGPYCGEWRTE